MVLEINVLPLQLSSAGQMVAPIRSSIHSIIHGIVNVSSENFMHWKLSSKQIRRVRTCEFLNQYSKKKLLFLENERNINFRSTVRRYTPMMTLDFILIPYLEVSAVKFSLVQKRKMFSRYTPLIFVAEMSEMWENEKKNSSPFYSH